MFGPSYEDTLYSSSVYGDLLLAQGKFVPGERMFRGALPVARARETLEGDNKMKLGLVYNLSNVLRVQGRLEEAQPLALEVLDATRRSLGSSHPDTLASPAPRVTVSPAPHCVRVLV